MEVCKSVPMNLAEAGRYAVPIKHTRPQCLSEAGQSRVLGAIETLIHNALLVHNGPSRLSMPRYTATRGASAYHCLDVSVNTFSSFSFNLVLSPRRD